MGQPAAAPLEPERPLPPLRDELRLIVRGDGALIFDPVRHAYFQLPAIAAQALAHWHLRLPSRICAAVRNLTKPDLDDLLGFLSQSRLTKAPAGGVDGLEEERKRSEHSLGMKLVHNYLSFRIPLVRPQRFLDAAAPWVLPLVSRPAIALVVACTLAGLYLTSRQWDAFTSTFLHFFSAEGFVLYGLTLIFLKVFHELGHAFTAQRFGARVPVMGVAVMMMMPMLYTDVTDAWRLASKRERLLIGAAGMLTEFAIAGLALFVWAFLADGPARSAAFFLATTAWIGSLAVNLSPFMRFDGYHLLADALEVPNLGPRSFALARWRLREALFGLGDPPPEQLGAALRRTLIGYAWFTWIYRLLLFTGIALLVYYAFPKVLGIPLFVIEIVFFIARPVMKELQEWHGRRREIAGQRRAWAILGVLIVVAALAALPLDRHVSVPAVLMAGAEWRAFAPEPAQVRKVRVRPGQIVAAGEVLAELTSPELDAETARAQLRLDIAEARLQRIAADARDRALMSVLERERLALRQSIAGLAGRRALLTLRSPIAGVVDRMAEGLQPGAWVGRKSPLFEVIGQGPPVLRGLADEAGIARIGPAAIGSFIPEDAQVPAIPARLQTIGAARGAGPELLLLASIHGGAIAATSDVNRQPVAKAGVFPITAEAGATPPRRMIRGTLILEAEPASFAGLAAKRILSVLLRESGF